ncbi:MAG TPA: four helix bundle protein [Vicinamibacterales bacterium]|jgi:four helix bundle protein
MTDTIRSFRELFVWQKSMDLAVRTYRVAQHLPRDDRPVLGYQLRKSSLSMPSNIAEGFSRHSTPHYIQHLWTAHASGAELETQIELGQRLDLIVATQADLLIRDAQEIARMINGLVGSLERSEQERLTRKR